MAVIKRAGALGALFLCAAMPASAEESSAAPRFEKANYDYKEVKTREGLIFRVPSDMPIEMRDGIQAPIPFDEYIYGKFAAADAKMASLDRRLAGIEEKLGRLAAPVSGDAVIVKTAGEKAGVLKAGEE